MEKVGDTQAPQGDWLAVARKLCDSVSLRSLDAKDEDQEKESARHHEEAVRIVMGLRRRIEEAAAQGERIVPVAPVNWRTDLVSGPAKPNAQRPAGAARCSYVVDRTNVTGVPAYVFDLIRNQGDFNPSIELRPGTFGSLDESYWVCICY